MANVVVSAIATFNGKALKKGQKELSAFDKQAQKLGKTFTKVFGAVAVASFAKNSVNAFIESEKAAAKLRTTVENLGLSFQQPAIEDYLKSLSLQFGIIDENLIPGFQRLLIATKDVTKAQSLFETALNVSAGTGKDLTSVSTSLSKAYMGDNAALGRLGVGLSKAQLKSASFLDIQKTLNANFAGQAKAAVSGYAGDMAKLTVAIDESKEAIGKGLLDALKALSGDTSIDTFTAKLVNAADTLGRYISNVGEFLSVLLPTNTVKVNGEWVRKSSMYTGTPFGQAGSAAENKRIRDATKLRTTENALIKEKNALEDLKKKYDVERIGLMLALNQATDEETRLRIAEKLAILDGNAAKAAQYLAETELTFQANQLAQSMNKAANAALYFSDWATYRAGERGDASIVSSAGGGGAVGVSSIPAPSMTMASDYASYRAGERGDINITVEGSILSDQDLTDTIQRTILQINKQGRGTTPAGGLSGGT